MQTQSRGRRGALTALAFMGLSACSSTGRVLETTKASQSGTGGDTGAGAASADGGGTGGAASTGTGGDGTAAGGVSSSGGAAPGTGGGTSASGVPSADGGPCVGTAYRSERLATDFYLMVDQSSSMGDPFPGGTTWWSAVQSGIVAYVDSPSAAGTSVGIQYFPLDGVAPASCVAKYDAPEVELGALPANGIAIAESVGKHGPTAFTPTAPALTGAIDHMKTWSATHPSRRPAVVLVTDGFPTECDPMSIVDIAGIAKAGLDAGVRTFVVGLNLGAGGQNLDAIAAAGGTSHATLIDSGDVPGQIVSALLAATSTTPVCTFQFPTSPGGVAADQVDVRYGTLGGPDTILPQRASLAACGSSNDGFYVDDPAHPTELLLCPATCARPIDRVDVLACPAP